MKLDPVDVNRNIDPHLFAGILSHIEYAEYRLLLLSYNYTRAWRLKSWDRFYIPVPFSRINVRVDDVGSGKDLAGGDPKAAAVLLKERLMAITEDDEYFNA